MWLLAAALTFTFTAWRTITRRGPMTEKSVQKSDQNTETAARTSARGTAPLVALLVAALAASLAQTIVIAALPVLGGELRASATAVTWVLTAFMLSSAVSTPIAGRLGDLFGYRRVMLACLGCFTAGTVVCALAAGQRSLGWLIAGRVLQGVAGGAFPLAFGIARSSLPPDRVRGVVALLSAMFGIGGAVGMVVAGPMIDGLGTASLFWATLVLALAALALSGALPSARPAARTGRVDVAGALLLSVVLVCVLLAISQSRVWGAGAIAATAGAAVLASAVFAFVETKVADPLVDLRLMRRRTLAVTNLTTLIVGAAMFGVITLIPRFIQTPEAAGYGFGASATEVGLVMVPVALVMLVAGPVAARLAGRLGARVPLQAGAVCGVAAFLLLAVVHDRLWHFYAAGLIVGAGYGLAFASVGTLTVESVEPHQTGVATGVNTIVRTVGGAVGAQIAAAVLAAHTPGQAPIPVVSGYTQGFAGFAALALVAFAAALALPRPR